MTSENRMALRRSLIPLALLAALAATTSCTDPSPLGVPAFRRGGRGQEGSTKGTGLLACSQTYDSVTQVVGPAGGFIVVGSHFLWVDTLALADTVRITAVAPSGRVRSVRFKPDGLVFQKTAFLVTSYANCNVKQVSAPKIAQISDAMEILGYLGSASGTDTVFAKTYDKTLYVGGELHHFSNYAVAW